MPGSHVPVALGDGSGDSEVPVLAVHVVGAGPGVVSQPDAEVLDLEWLPLPYLLQGHDLSGGLLELTELPQESETPRSVGVRNIKICLEMSFYLMIWMAWALCLDPVSM